MKGATAGDSLPITVPTGRIPGLDGLRGLAILLVLVAHGCYSLPAFTAPWIKFIGNGALGVNVFFVLSGFLIHQLSLRELDRTGGFNWRQFYLRRVLRIFPCFYVYIAVVTVLTLAGVYVLTAPMLLSAATFTLNYRHLWEATPLHSDYFVIGHYWTLTLEEQFYLTWPLLMWLAVRRRLLPLLVLVVLLAPVVRVATYFFTPGSREQIGMMFHTGFDAIAAGVLLGELLRNPRANQILHAIIQPRWTVPAIILFLTVISPLILDRFHGAYSITIGKTLELTGIAVVLIAVVSRPATALARFLNWRPLMFIGVLSYSLYVWNPLFLNPAAHSALNALPVNFLGAFLAALLSHYLIERPFLALKDRFH
jgi:peptidoglycan/LPS O-acetylase OafA/YrhL